MSDSRRTFAYFAGTGLSWGLGFMFIRIAVVGLSPLMFVFGRAFIATLVLGAVMAATRRRWPTGWLAWRRISVLSVFGMAIPFLLYAWAGQRIPSGLSGIYNAAVPISTVLLSVAVMRQERLGPRKLLGILVGGIGVLIVLEPWNLLGSSFDLPGQMACIIAVLFLGFAFSYTRRAITPLGLDPIGVAAAQTLVTTLFSLLLMPVVGVGTIELSVPIVLSMLAVGALSTGFAYIWNFRVIETWGAASASMVTYLVTIVSVTAGMLVLGEMLTLPQFLGAVIVLAGVALGISSKR
jgi:drug/metabolite transporter (DMT)-like permease